MEATIERIIFFFVGSGFGWILHIIVSTIRDTRKEVHEVLEIERRHDDSGILQHRVAFNVCFTFMMIFVFYAAYASFQNGRDLKENAEEDFVRVCVAAEDIRDVQRSTVDAVYALATSIVNRPADAPKRTPEEIGRANLFILRANEFRTQSYANIQPTKECEPYVTDIGVEPPTPDQPLLK